MAKSSQQRVWPQFLVAFLSNMGTLTFGLTIGWLSPLQTRLMSDDSPLGPDAPPLTTTEISWVGAMPAIALVFGTPFFGYAIQKTGRKMSSLIGNLPSLVAFGLLMYSTDVYMVYVARFIAGFAAAGCLITTPIYVNECSRSDLRGVLGSVSSIFINSGVIIAFALGAYTTYNQLNLACMSFTALFLLAYPWLPESPAHLVNHNKIEEATNALVKLRGGPRSDIDLEIKQLASTVTSTAGSRSVLTLLRDTAFRRGIVIVTGVYTIQQFSGISAILTYNAFILQTAGSIVPPHLAATISAVCQLCGSSTGAFLVDRTGRRSLLLFSSLLMGFSHLALTLFAFTMEHHTSPLLNWIPPISLMTYIFTYAIGFGTVPFVLLPELFSADVRGVAVSVIGSAVSILCFLINLSFPILADHIYLSGCFSIFAVSSFLGFIFVYYLVFETKNKTTNEILRMLRTPEDAGAASAETVELQRTPQLKV